MARAPLHQATGTSYLATGASHLATGASHLATGASCLATGASHLIRAEPPYAELHAELYLREPKIAAIPNPIKPFNRNQSI